jgi:hypothetical protein
MDETERYAEGMAMRRKVLGNAWVDRAEANKTDFNAEFQAMITRSPWGDIWTRPHFNERTRRILVIGTMMAHRPVTTRSGKPVRSWRSLPLSAEHRRLTAGLRALELQET